MGGFCWFYLVLLVDFITNIYIFGHFWPFLVISIELAQFRDFRPHLKVFSLQSYLGKIWSFWAGNLQELDPNMIQSTFYSVLSNLLWARPQSGTAKSQKWLRQNLYFVLIFFMSNGKNPLFLDKKLQINVNILL
jgi:hypothetical protein